MRTVHLDVETISKENICKSSSIITAFPLEVGETNVVSILKTIVGAIWEETLVTIAMVEEVIVVVRAGWDTLAIVHLIVVIIVSAHGLQTIVAFLFKEGNWVCELRLN